MTSTQNTPNADRTALSVAVIGAGPRGAGVLERLAANLGTEWNADRSLTVHFIDPFPAGPGRIWRFDQSPLLKLNSMAADVTMFTDETSVIDGPVRPGPSLIEWIDQVRAGAIELPPVDAALAAEIAQLTGSSFPTRRLQSLYLDWFFRRAVDDLATAVTVQVHLARAARVDDLPGGDQLVVLDDGATIEAHLVLFSLGHNGSQPEPEHAELASFAEWHGRVYLPPAFTADADLSGIRPGENLIVRGFGLAAVDLTVLLTEGRGGRFDRNDDGELVYLPSGNEPRLFLGSRRGVPYRSKISSTLVGDRPVPRFFTPAVAAQLESTSESLDFTAQVWPLIAQESLWGYYRELFTGHPERVSLPWAEFADRFAAIDPRALPIAAGTPVAADARRSSHPLVDFAGDAAAIEDGIEAFRALVAEGVPDPIDRIFLPEFDRPLHGLRFGSAEELQAALREYIRGDLDLRTRPEHSATLGLFVALLTSLFTLSDIIDSPKWTAESRVRDIHGWWLGYFSFIASGPPGHRLEELVALSEAGVVEFLGGDLWVDADEQTGLFRAGSANVDRVVTAAALVDARLPDTSVSRSDNELLRALIASGGGVEELVADGDYVGSTGRLLVRQHDTRVVDANGGLHERRFAIGPYTNSPFVGAFSRPRTNAISFRENDKVARALLRHLAALHAPAPASIDA
ncbi:FAD/NAD(P)-binding protein [Cryobacterium arcticum]|uniref:Adenylate cyclase n=1 Tax=Cryobacterium arcticum TaxID=670052 RepID=A0A318A3D4_9MICO|nr:FAD/NAD(P)-binding protein [Cryobacterium arcticum]PXA71877.1 adenylate cyclase [Cryobacterium arcticum]